MLAGIGYVGANASADAFTVESAQREPEAVRGTRQSVISFVHTVFFALNALTGFLFNGKDYGGDFDYSLSFPQLMIILTVLTLPVIPITSLFIKEEKHPRVHVSEFWELLQSHAMYPVVAYRFLSGIIQNAAQTVSSPIESNWVLATPLNDAIAAVINQLVLAAVLFAAAK